MYSNYKIGKEMENIKKLYNKRQKNEMNKTDMCCVLNKKSWCMELNTKTKLFIRKNCFKFVSKM